VKLFSKNSNLYDHDTSTSQTDGQTDGRTDEQHAMAIPRYAVKTTVFFTFHGLGPRQSAERTDMALGKSSNDCSITN